jgi:hypothetical protein
MSKSVIQITHDYVKEKLQGFTLLCTSGRKIVFCKRRGNETIMLAVSQYDKDQVKVEVETSCIKKMANDVKIVFENHYKTSHNSFIPILDRAIEEVRV